MMRSKKISLNHVEMAYIYKPKDTLVINLYTIYL
jgi:hypothetical protein